MTLALDACGIWYSTHMTSLSKKLKDAFGPRSRGRNLLITALLVLCAVEINALARDFHTASQADAFRRDYESSHQLDKNNPDIDQIQSWMTFDYLNTIFKLPPAYLKTSLVITDTSYPNLHIGAYAHDAHLTQAQALAKVQEAITAYAPTAS